MRNGLTFVVGSLIAGMTGAFIALSISGTPAVATHLLATDLGPAEALILSAKAGDPLTGPLTLTNQGGRISWSDSATARAYSVACVCVDRLMKGILSSDRFMNERKKFDEEALSQREEFDRRNKELQTRYPGIKPDDAQFEEAKRAFVALQSEYEQWFASVQRIQSKHMAEQVEKAYRELLVALDVVAERKKIDFVYRFIPHDRPFEAVELADAMMQVQARPFLRYPAATDITDEIFKEMGMPPVD